MPACLPPPTLDDFSGLCFMGGPMSVNDDLPWIPPVLRADPRGGGSGYPGARPLPRRPIDAKALGGSGGRNPVKEIGWGEVEATDAGAREWFGDIDRFEAFHWHGETFTIPPGATRILRARYCANQAFVIGPAPRHAMPRRDDRGDDSPLEPPLERREGHARPFCATAEEMVERMETRIAAMRIAADLLYTRWIEGLNRRIPSIPQGRRSLSADGIASRPF